MDFWSVVIIASSAGTMLAIGVIELRRRRTLRTREQARKLLRPSNNPRWNVDHPWPDMVPKLLSGEPVKQVPPNIGGIGHPPYEGPNYFDPASVADYLRPVPHYGRMSLREVEQGDLAWEFESGCVAPDGSIWLTADSRAAFGVVTVPTFEAPKAARFGWQIVDGSQAHGYVEVRREHQAIDPDQYLKD